MDASMFTRGAPGTVVRVGQGDTAYHAFVPAPLPPQLTFDLPLVSALAAAERALGELRGLAQNNPSIGLLRAPFMRQEAVLSSRIEGTVSTVADVYAYEAGQLGLPGQSAAPPEHDVREVLNYVEALEFGLSRLASLPLSTRFIRELHERLLRGVRGGYATPGAFRISQNWIGDAGATLNTAVYVPPPVPEMTEALSALETYLHAEELAPALIRVAWVHYQFEAIHPFVDGNGRVGRLLITLLLVHWGLLPVPVVYPSVYLERNRAAYYEHLLAVSTQGAWEAWLAFFLHAMADAAQQAVQKALRLDALRSHWRGVARASGRSSLLEQIVDMVFAAPVITANGVIKAFGVTHPSAMGALLRLEAAGLLREVTGQVRNRIYAADLVLEALH
ncbi:MAG: Fic family protein [Dehalococcoidia bacterium]|nr:Fic family protein [Dehalococcoidia bacterium]